MSRNKGYQKNKHGRGNPSVGDKAREVLANIGEDNPVIQMFKEFAKELDEKQDRYERIVKLSRDITIESKRIIFLLHSTNTDMDSKKLAICEEANMRLQNLIDKNFRLIANELKGQDPYFYQRAFTNGMQEFIEALVLYQYLKMNHIESWEMINKNFTYLSDDSNEGNEHFCLHFSPYDYILGIADFTGELMRRCINNLGVGNINECFKICNVVKHINTGFLGTVAPGHKEFGRKAYVLRQSLSKMELVCYNIQIRGSEVPKHMLASVMESNNSDHEDDEGFY